MIAALRAEVFGMPPNVRESSPAALGFAAVILVMLLGAFAGGVALYLNRVALDRATQVAAGYESALRGVHQESLLQVRGTAVPGSGDRIAHEAAGASVIAALQAVRASGSLADRDSAAEALAAHAERATLYGKLDAGTEAEAARMGQLGAQLEADIGAALNRARADLAGQVQAFALVQFGIFVATTLAFALGIGRTAFARSLSRNERREVEERLMREAMNARTREITSRGLVQSASDMILVCAAPGNVVYQADAAVRWTYAAPGLQDQSVLSLVHPEDQGALRELWINLPPSVANDAGGKLDLRLRDGTGDWRHVEFIATNRLHDQAVRGIVVTVRDITDRKAVELQLINQAFYDAVTRLPNTLLFHDRLEQALLRAARRKDLVAVLFISLDNLPGGAETVRDALLVEAAGRLRACVRAQDTVAHVRTGAFAIALESVATIGDVGRIAQGLIERLSHAFTARDQSVKLQASIGIGIGDVRRDHAAALLRNAELAMQRARSAGKAAFVLFDPALHESRLDRVELESDLRRADLAREMRIHYQPIVAIGSGVVSGVEALVRWFHPVHGLVAPNEFIPMAIETGLIVPLGRWVLAVASRQVAMWQQQMQFDPPLTLSVNLSTRQFQEPGLVADVASALTAAGLPPDCLKLEIAESAIMEDMELTVRTLWALKKLGIQLAIDDFGTGYASLAYLKQLPLELLKIDGSFVAGIGRDPEDTATARSIVGVAKSLGLQVTGEGIETAAQAAALADWGCNLGQGYHYSKALDQVDTAAYLRRVAEKRSGGMLRPPLEVAMPQRVAEAVA